MARGRSLFWGAYREPEFAKVPMLSDFCLRRSALPRHRQRRCGSARPLNRLTQLCRPISFSRQTQRPPRETVAAWIRQLGDDRFDVRESASEHLSQMGIEVRPALEKRHLVSPDPEVRYRAYAVFWKRSSWRMSSGGGPPSLTTCMTRSTTMCRAGRNFGKLSAMTEGLANCSPKCTVPSRTYSRRSTKVPPRRLNRWKNAST